MSNHDELPAFTGSGDAQEEALWQAYQAMLRRRKGPRPRWSGPESPIDASPPPPRSEPPPRRAAPGGAARRIFPRDPEARALEPSPLVFRPVDSLEPDLDAAGARPGASGARPRVARAAGRRIAAARAAALGVALALGAGVALVIAFWPHDRGRPGAAAKAGHSPGLARIPAASDVTAPRPTLPCLVGGQLIGQFTREDCVSRQRVASGAIQVEGVGSAPPPPPVHPPSLRPLAEQTPTPAPRVRPRRLMALHTASALTGFAAVAKLRPAAEMPPQRASALAVREFYDALGRGDGARAAAVVVPEKRGAGPLSAEALTEYYSRLHSPLRVTKIDPINDDTVFVRYEFVTADDHVCVGAATVSTSHRNGDTLVNGVRTFSGC
jgi:hypothetical protein